MEGMDLTEEQRAALEGMPRAVRSAYLSRLERGLAVRVSPSDPWKGRCGARGERTGKPCGKLAGLGTKHRGYGRCKGHKGVEEGLPPWFGPFTEEEARANFVFGASDPGMNGKHGASRLVVNDDLEEIFGRYLDEEELAMMRVAMKDPVRLLSTVMGARAAALVRIQRYQRAQVVRNQGVTTPEVLASEALADRAATTIARLAEARKAFMEYERATDTHAALKTMLSKLSDDDFARLRADPAALAGLLGTGQG